MGFQSSDVNTIFAYTDIRHKFYRVVTAHFDKTKSEKYILLTHVYTTFRHTYSDNLKRIGDMIIKAVNKVKIDLSKRRLKTKPTEILKNSMLKKELDEIMEQQREKEFSPTDYDYYTNILLKDYPLIELLNDKEKFERFDSHYVELADEITRNKLDEFISLFRNIEKLPKLDRNKIREQRDNLKEIKSSNNDIFISPDDEDIRLSAEFFTYCIQRGISLDFVSTDRNIIKSLNFVKNKDKIKCGKIIDLLQNN